MAVVERVLQTAGSAAAVPLCKRCHATGYVGCDRCRGAGIVVVEHNSGFGSKFSTVACPKCKQKAFVPCPECGGTGGYPDGRTRTRI